MVRRLIHDDQGLGRLEWVVLDLCEELQERPLVVSLANSEPSLVVFRGYRSLNRCSVSVWSQLQVVRLVLPHPLVEIVVLPGVASTFIKINDFVSFQEVLGQFDGELLLESEHYIIGIEVAKPISRPVVADIVPPVPLSEAVRTDFCESFLPDPLATEIEAVVSPLPQPINEPVLEGVKFVLRMTSGLPRTSQSMVVLDVSANDA